MYQANRSMTAKGPSLTTSQLDKAVIAQARNVTTWATKRAKMNARRGAIVIPLIRKLQHEAGAECGRKREVLPQLGNQDRKPRQGDRAQGNRYVVLDPRKLCGSAQVTEQRRRGDHDESAIPLGGDGGGGPEVTVFGGRRGLHGTGGSLDDPFTSPPRGKVGRAAKRTDPVGAIHAATSARDRTGPRAAPRRRSRESTPRRCPCPPPR